MLKLQGVIILRISDLRRFFNLREFLGKKQDFIEYVDKNKNVFFDNGEQMQLYELVKSWLKGNVQNEEDARKVFSDSNSKLYVKEVKINFELGRLADKIKQIDRYKGDILGLTYLYLLLGANKADSKIDLEYDAYIQKMKGVSIGDIMYLENNLSFDSSTIGFPLERRYIVNNNRQMKIVISCGKRKEILEPNECAVVLFCNNKCCRVLPHRISDETYLMRLLFNPRTQEPYLEISKKQNHGMKETRIENVCSIMLEAGGYPVYLTTDGKMHYEEDVCFSLHQSYISWKEKGEKTIAFDYQGVDKCFFSSNKKSNPFF